MEKFEVLTLIKRDKKSKFSDFILGTISGIGYAECGFQGGFTIWYIDEGYVYRNRFTVDQYDHFMNVIEKLYPGLCKFNYQVKNKEESIM